MRKVRDETGLAPFTTDGCSGGMSVAWMYFFNKKTPWDKCCVDHDRPYHRGGTKVERKEADKQLRECVSKKGYHFWAFMMYWAVRTGGVWWLPTPWRWGYGRKGLTPYTKENKNEES